MVKVYIGLGSNIGDKLSNIRKAIYYTKKILRVTKISPIYKTEPVGYKKQDWFLNCVVEAKTDKRPYELLAFLKSIEKKLKRKKTFRYGPRTIDMDILFYNDKIIKSKNLQVPHPRMHRRLFVLEPLSKISPSFIHPKLRKTILGLKNTLKSKKGVKLYRYGKLFKLTIFLFLKWFYEAK